MRLPPGALALGLALLCLAALCSSAPEGSGGGSGVAQCGAECQRFKEKMRAFKRNLTECMNASNVTAQSLKTSRSCRNDTDENVLKYKVCWSRKRGIMHADHSVNTRWWAQTTERQEAKCAAFRQLRDDGELPASPRLERACQRSQEHKAKMEQCLQQGSAAQRPDEGLSAMRAMHRCFCELRRRKETPRPR